MLTLGSPTVIFDNYEEMVQHRQLSGSGSLGLWRWWVVEWK